MKVVSVTNLKGGSAKSTTAFNLAGALVERGYKVLAINAEFKLFGCGGCACTFVSSVDGG